MDIEERTPGTYYFNFSFYAHEIQFANNLKGIKNPAVAIRFLDFPTMMLRATSGIGGKLILDSGKKCSFKMHSDDLSRALSSKLAYIMLVDADPKDTSIIASCTLDLKMFSRDQVFFGHEEPGHNVKRAQVVLFDRVRNQVAKLDASISISLLD